MSDETNPKDAFADRKPNLALFPPVALVEAAKVMELGAAKYGAYNWRTKRVRRMVYLAAALRHLAADLDGEDTDPESGQPHLAHVLACCAIVLDARAGDNLVDDRPAKGAAAQAIRELTRVEVLTTMPGRSTCKYCGAGIEIGEGDLGWMHLNGYWYCNDGRGPNCAELAAT